MDKKIPENLDPKRLPTDKVNTGDVHRVTDRVTETPKRVTERVTGAPKRVVERKTAAVDGPEKEHATKVTEKKGGWLWPLLALLALIVLALLAWHFLSGHNDNDSKPAGQTTAVVTNTHTSTVAPSPEAK